MLEANGGLIDRPFDVEEGANYDAACERWGLVGLLHPKAVLSPKDMEAFPVFVDTPERQRCVKDQDAWRRRVRRLGTYISDRDLRRYLARQRVPEQGFRLPVERLHPEQLDRSLEILALHSQGRSVALIEDRLGLSPRTVRRRLAHARKLLKIQRARRTEGPSKASIKRVMKHSKTCRHCTSSTLCPVADRLLSRLPGQQEALLKNPDAIETRLDADQVPARGKGHRRPL